MCIVVVVLCVFLLVVLCVLLWLSCRYCCSCLVCIFSSCIVRIVVAVLCVFLFISVFNQFDAQNLFHNKFYFMSIHVSSTCANHQEVKIALHSLWYHHTYRWPSRARVDRTSKFVFVVVVLCALLITVLCVLLLVVLCVLLQLSRVYCC